jgi:transcription initiation factor TFIIB
MSFRGVYTDGFDEQTGNQTPSEDCPECEGTLATDGGETRCTKCGLILDEYRIDHRGAPTYPEDEDSRARTGAPLTQARHDRGLSTKIGDNLDGNGGKLPDAKRKQLTRLRREHNRAKFQSKSERNLSHGCTEIARLVSALGLSKAVREHASQLFRTAQNEDLLHGRSIEAMAAGCVYAVCRLTNHTRTLDVVVEVSRVDHDAIWNAYSVLNRELELPTPPRRPREYIPGHASAVDLPPETERFARQLAERAFEAEISIGPNPSGFAAACLEVAADQQDVEVYQYELAEAAGVSPMTVRKNREALQARVVEWDG